MILRRLLMWCEHCLVAKTPLVSFRIRDIVTLELSVQRGQLLLLIFVHGRSSVSKQILTDLPNQLSMEHKSITIFFTRATVWDGYMHHYHYVNNIERAVRTYEVKMRTQKRGFRTLLAYIGPGFLVAIGYIDPGNFETDLQAGARFKYELLWIILVASFAALLIQSLAANLGVVTGKHLAEHCKAEYPKKVSFGLWIGAEVAVVACDIPEVLGSAFALNLLFHIPVWAGVLLTGLSTLILLGLQQYGVRKLEMLITFLVFTMAACFFADLAYARPSPTEVVQGMFVPRLNGNGATGLAISLLGAMVMPYAFGPF